MLPNPRLAIGRTRPAGGSATLFDGRNQTDTSIEFPLLLAGQRGARIEAAERFIDAARARVRLGENQLAEEAAVAFLAILAVQGEQRGEQRGLRQGVAVLCRALGIELTEERARELASLNAAGLGALLARIEEHKSWT